MKSPYQHHLQLSDGVHHNDVGNNDSWKASVNTNCTGCLAWGPTEPKRETNSSAGGNYPYQFCVTTVKVARSVDENYIAAARDNLKENIHANFMKW